MSKFEYQPNFVRVSTEIYNNTVKEAKKLEAKIEQLEKQIESHREALTDLAYYSPSELVLSRVKEELSKTWEQENDTIK